MLKKNIVKLVIEKCYNKMKIICKKLFCVLFRMLPINNKKIVFDNFSGLSYGCNPKYITEELIRQKVDCQIVWLLNEKDNSLNKCIKQVKYNSIYALFELATAKVWVFNVRIFKGVKKRKKQFYIQTWHGTLNLKKCEAEVENNLRNRYVEEAIYDGSITDLVISTNSFMTNFFKRSFWYQGDIKEIGLPRNDILYAKSEKTKNKVYDYFKISLDTNIVIYAPTFRNSDDFSVYCFEYEKCCRLLEKITGQEYVMLIKMHPNVKNLSDKLVFSDKIKNATEYPDIQEILSVSDLLITDYSSVSIDMALAGKKVILLCKDLELYKASERSLNFELKELPFAVSKNETELFNNILTFDYKKYIERCNQFFESVGMKRIECASENVVEIIKRKIEGE